MSLESAMDEERREVMNILEGRPRQPPHSSNGPGSGQDVRTSSTAPPIRSMLDIGTGAPRHGSIAGSTVGIITPPVRTTPVVRSMLDPPSSPPPPRTTHRATTSPTYAHSPDSGMNHRTQSGAASQAPKSRPRASSDHQRDGGGLPYAGSQFDMSSTVHGQALPKRVTQGGKKGLGISSMTAIIQGQELETLPIVGDRGRHNSTAGIIGGISTKSKSPSSRLSNRSESPGGSMLSVTNFNKMTTPGTFVTDGGKVIDMNNAYRRLSDANLLKSGGQLSSLPVRAGNERAHVSNGETLSPKGEVRLQKDYYTEDENAEAAVETSDEDYTTDEEAWGSNVRGRKRSRRKKGLDGADPNISRDENSKAVKSGPAGMGRSAGVKTARSLLAAAEEERLSVSSSYTTGAGPNRTHSAIESGESSNTSLASPAGMGRSSGPRMARSLLGAAEEERLAVSSKYKVKSLLEPTITVSGPAGERLSRRNSVVHPNTNYNSQISGATSPVTSDSEDLGDIRRAQRLTINQSPIDSSVQRRVIRTIIRGEYSKMVEEADQGSRRIRKYLVATDLSSEAAYALEWTIGTVLRDGDSLYAVYAVDEEIGTGKTANSENSENMESLPVGQGGLAMQETTAMVDRLTAATQNTLYSMIPSPLAGPALLSSGRESRAGSTDSRSLPRADQERFHAIELISQTCIKFLRKTKLQVRVGVEVIHCKSPKHMITEAIDELEPTLVILGSRGRSALKGVLLGSFSNYLVTKSSVPVMVARKKLQKPNAKNRLPHSRLVNNLTPSRSLADAKID